MRVMVSGVIPPWRCLSMQLLPVGILFATFSSRLGICRVVANILFCLVDFAEVGFFSCLWLWWFAIGSTSLVVV